MKKLILAVLTTLLATIVCARPYAIAKVGAQFSKFNYEDSQSLFGVRGGVGGFFQLGESSFYLMPQAVYAQKGQKSEDYIGQTTIHYAEVPLTVGAFVKFSRNVGLGLMVGPYVAVGVAGKSESPYPSDPFETISRFDAGLSGGIQLHIWKIFVFADYDWGLRNILKPNELFKNETLSTRSGAVGLGFCY